jgi:hypothetical protein
MAIGARSVDLGCPWREHAEGTEKKKPEADRNQPKTHVSAYKAAQDQAKPSFNPFAKKT